MSSNLLSLPSPRLSAALLVAATSVAVACGDDGGTGGTGGVDPTSASSTTTQVSSSAQSTQTTQTTTSAVSTTSATTATASSSSGGEVCTSVLWSQSFTAPGDQYVNDLARDDAGNLFVTGVTKEPIDLGGGVLPVAGGLGTHFLTKRDTVGDHVWSKAIGDVGFTSFAELGTDASGSVVFAGNNGGTVDFGNGPITNGGFVGKLDPQGTALWSFGFNASVRHLDVGADGDVALTGSLGFDFSFPGGPVLSGDADAPYVALFSSDGTHLWSTVLPGIGVVEGIAIDHAGRVVVAWYTYNDDFAYVARLTQYDVDGALLWHKDFDPESWITSLALDAGDRILVAGSFYDPLDLGGGPLIPAGPFESAFLGLFDSGGNHLWSKTVDSVDYVEVRDAVFDASGRVHLGGAFNGTVDFGGGALSAPGTNEGFLVVLDGDGNHVASMQGGPMSYAFPHVEVDDAGNTIVALNYVDGRDLGCGPLPYVDGSEIGLAALAFP